MNVWLRGVALAGGALLVAAIHAGAQIREAVPGPMPARRAAANAARNSFIAHLYVQLPSPRARAGHAPAARWFGICVAGHCVCGRIIPFDCIIFKVYVNYVDKTY